MHRRYASNLRGASAGYQLLGRLTWLVAAPLVIRSHAQAGAAAPSSRAMPSPATPSPTTPSPTTPSPATPSPTTPSPTTPSPTTPSPAMPAAASVPAPQARKPLADADAWCDERTGDVFRKIGDGWHEISGEGEGEYVDETAYRLYWRGRLDRDKRNDMVFTTACTPVQCEYLFYVQCADGTFSRVFTTTATNMVIKPQRKTWAHVRYSAITDEVNGRYRKEWMTAALGVDLR